MTANRRRVALVTAGLSVPSSTRMLGDRLAAASVAALDPEALAGRPVLLAATAGTARHSLVLEHAMRPLFAHLRAVTAPTAVFAASQDWGGTAAGALSERVDRAAGELADLVTGRPATPAGPADPFADPVDGVDDFASLLRRG